VISVEAPADCLKGRIGVVPGKVHGNLPWPYQILLAGPRDNLGNRYLEILANQFLDDIDSDRVPLPDDVLNNTLS
jgi:hypothetical protein